jgi:hypothetical protein
MPTYRNFIQDIIRDIDKLYDKIGALRDSAASNEKNVYNDSRGTLGAMLTQWRHFDNSLPEDRASRVINGDWPDRLK